VTLLTDEAQTFDTVWWIFFWIAMAIGALVSVLVVYCVIRFRRRDAALPRQVHHNLPIEVMYTVVPLLIVAGLSVVTLVSLADIERVDEPDLVVDVTAFQWQWRFEYPASGVVVSGAERADRPVLVLPSDSTVRFRLTAQDVIHSFWVPEFRFKLDMWPGEVQEFDVAVSDRTGDFPDAGACAEFCGLDHSTMRFSLRIVTPAEFDAWIVEQGGDLAAPDGAEDEAAHEVEEVAV
jgi:cytochrome c oxidase subunit II